MEPADACAFPAGPLRIEVLYSPAPRTVWQRAIELPAGSTLAQAIEASGVCGAFPDLAAGAARVGVWGRAEPLSHVLRDHDRVEIYRPLTVDPKEARRLRYDQQGVRKRPPRRALVKKSSG